MCNSLEVMSDLGDQICNAVGSSNAELLKHALRKGANVNILVESGISLLGRAIQIGNEEVIYTILDAKIFLPAEGANDAFGIHKQDVENHEDNFDWDSLKENKQSFLHEDGQKQGSKRAKNVQSKNSLAPEGYRKHGLKLFHSLRSHAFQKYECDVNLPDFYDRMPIHYAAETGNANVVRRLLQAGCRVNVSDNHNITPLHLSVKYEHPGVVELLLKAGSRINSKTSDKSSALHLACSRGYCAIVQLLLKHGANIEILDASEQTPLLVAVTRAHHDVVKLLLTSGSKANVEEIHGYTPLSEAVWRGDLELAQILLTFGAKMNAQHHLLHFTIRHNAVAMCKLLVKSGAFLNGHDDTGDGPVHVAIRSSQIEVVKLLLEYGSSPSLRCSISGRTPIHIAVDILPETNFKIFSDILKLLISFGANIDSQSYTPGDTPLFRSILNDKYMFTEELIRHGCDPNLGNVFSCKIDNLCLAVTKKHFRTVKLLIYSGFLVRSNAELNFDSQEPDEIQNFLMSVKINPLPLSKLCRIAIRQHMRVKIFLKVDQLRIPMLLKNFLLFYDCEFSLRV